jgi:hypothetical protein
MPFGEIIGKQELEVGHVLLHLSQVCSNPVSAVSPARKVT